MVDGTIGLAATVFGAFGAGAIFAHGAVAAFFDKTRKITAAGFFGAHVGLGTVGVEAIDQVVFVVVNQIAANRFDTRGFAEAGGIGAIGEAVVVVVESISAEFDSGLRDVFRWEGIRRCGVGGCCVVWGIGGVRGIGGVGGIG